MTKIIAVRLNQEQLHKLEMFRQRYNIKSTSEALRRLMNKHYADVMSKQT